MANFVGDKDGATKQKITAIVNYYILENKEEFEIVAKGVSAKRMMTRNQYAGLEGSNWSRALYEIPETLSSLFITNLSEEETVWFKSKKGSHWFTRTFKAFALPHHV